MKLKYMETNGRKFEVPEDEDYLHEVEDLLSNDAVLSMQDFPQHGDTTCLDHCITVSYHSYITAKAKKWNARACARAGLLHDLFLYDWHENRHQGKGKLHGWTHPRTALKNAMKQFKLSLVEKEIILKHMWPITIIPPKYKETYLIVWFDKLCTLKESIVHRRHLVSQRRMRKAMAM